MRFGSPVGVVGFAAKVSCAVGITHPFSAAALMAASSIAVKAGESMLGDCALYWGARRPSAVRRLAPPLLASDES
jgi:hypothetical protein